MSEHQQALEEIKRAINNLPEEHLTTLNEVIEKVNSILMTHGELAMLAIAYIGASMAVAHETQEASNERPQ